ncbi:methylated-DNA--[protein]-cysteine S-methyltransferase [Paenibacillus glycanilyticus]|uniref:methylated-DNA--[protein]-cysteine S-methyltransferase n=1 Tax=Paenibacillus glycanilyticus TaxID=126569 RepID=UPI00203DC8C4|nr:methylated-DNA--[protein]-cysteine S-methyltransferase [Paenibacillus glycanilyticus]MCM3628520.1 methylated-DNA--[protein]-cysteine S-methyltransferase [Paenibacillus glycanilyticus]
MSNIQSTLVYWDTLVHPVLHHRPIYLVATDKGLVQVTLPHESIMENVRAWVTKKIPNAILTQEPAKVAPYKLQLQEYLEGSRKKFTFSLDFRGTPFQNLVWQALFNIPYGEMRSYAEIAESVGNPKAVRAVGTANGRNPIPIVVPCHRVIGKNNTLTGFRGGLQMKEELLHLEGVQSFKNIGHEKYRF